MVFPSQTLPLQLNQYKKSGCRLHYTFPLQYCSAPVRCPLEKTIPDSSCTPPCFRSIENLALTVLNIAEASLSHGNILNKILDTPDIQIDQNHSQRLSAFCIRNHLHRCYIAVCTVIFQLFRFLPREFPVSTSSPCAFSAS